jgi:hypothetical protein
MVHAYNSSTRDNEEGELQIQSQPGLLRKTISKKQKFIIIIEQGNANLKNSKIPLHTY